MGYNLDEMEELSWLLKAVVGATRSALRYDWLKFSVAIRKIGGTGAVPVCEVALGTDEHWFRSTVCKPPPRAVQVLPEEAGASAVREVLSSFMRSWPAAKPKFKVTASFLATWGSNTDVTIEQPVVLLQTLYDLLEVSHGVHPPQGQLLDSWSFEDEDKFRAWLCTKGLEYPNWMTTQQQKELFCAAELLSKACREEETDGE